MCIERWLAPIYLLGVLLTFGHEAARFDREWPASPATPPPEGGAIAAAITWPAYVPLRLSWAAFEEIGDD